MEGGKILQSVNDLFFMYRKSYAPLFKATQNMKDVAQKYIKK